MIQIYPSLASSNQANLTGEIQRLRDHPYLHFDIEDGNFVDNISFGLKTIRAVRPLTAAAFDAHLMVTDPMRYIPALLDLQFQAIAFHWESTGYPLVCINAIHDGGVKAGIALNPATPVSAILDYLPLIDYVLLMAAEPDGRGDQFQPHVLHKIKCLHEAQLQLPLIVDGAVSADNLQQVVRAGASGVVMGRAVFSAAAPYAQIQKFSSISL